MKDPKVPCIKCGKDGATVHITNIVETTTQEEDFCRECALAEEIRGVKTAEQEQRVIDMFKKIFGDKYQEMFKYHPRCMVIRALRKDLGSKS